MGSQLGGNGFAVRRIGAASGAPAGRGAAGVCCEREALPELGPTGKPEHARAGKLPCGVTPLASCGFALIGVYEPAGGSDGGHGDGFSSCSCGKCCGDAVGVKPQIEEGRRRHRGPPVKDGERHLLGASRTPTTVVTTKVSDSRPIVVIRRAVYGEIAAGQGPAGRPKLAAFLGACAGRPAVGDTVLSYRVSAGGAIGA